MSVQSGESGNPKGLRVAVPTSSVGDPPDGVLATLPVPAQGHVPAVLHAAASAIHRGISGAMATVLERHGSAPGTPGQKLYLGADGGCVGTVGGGAVERAVLELLQSMIVR